ncbi:MAG: DUF1592 domain-containing protein [Myxococcales bacterium]|nr:DUF1592 domain-containing protein [Myxococcales bacterium]
MEPRSWTPIVALSLLCACDGLISEPGLVPGDEAPTRPGAVADLRLEPRVWRLGPAQFDAEVGRLFGEGAPAAEIPASAGEKGITNIASTARVDLGNADVFVAAARQIATWVVERGPEAARCRAWDDACLDDLLDWLPAEAYRRPLADDEREALRALTRDLRADFDPELVVAGLIRVVLLSPDFLYRTELGTGAAEVTLTEHEIATLLAFAVTDSAPDAELRRAADEGRLRDPSERERQARRLMNDSASMWQRFFWEWLHLSTLYSQGNEVGLDPALVGQMSEEYAAFVRSVVVEERGTLVELLTAPYTFARPELAAHYETPHPGGGLARVELDPEQRGGLLTQGAWLLAHGKRGRDNVVRRGMGIFIDAMCNEINVPPDLDLDAELDRLVGRDATVRQITEARGNDPTCGACHRIADPVGLVFERFASDGSWQDVYPDGLPVETRVRVEGLGELEDAPTLGAALVADTRFQHCLVRRLAHFALGADLGSPATVAWTRESHRAFVESGTSFEELLVALVRHPAFIERRNR